jgi:diguanylate cyclase (GGDEF)-like protein
MHEERMTQDSVEKERQQNRIKLAHIVVIFAVLQSALVNLFAYTGALSPTIGIAFAVVSIGAALIFWAIYNSGLNLQWEHPDLTLHHCTLLVLTQFAFIFLAPKLTILFLLVALIVFGYGMVQLNYYHFAVGWVAYSVSSGLVLWLMHDSFGYPGNSDLQLLLLWLFLSLVLGTFVMARIQSNRLRAQLSVARDELTIALAKLDGLGQHDVLTGVLNRRALVEALDSELLRARRTGHPFCFALIDLDHFRGINEKYGNAIGDMVLKSVSETAIKLLRALDRYGRTGGEEFGILLPATWLDQGVIAMGRLTKAVKETDWEKIAPGLSITFSAGITTNAVNDTAEIVIKRADEALKQAKQEGRDRIVQSEEALPDMPPIDLD